MSCKKCSGHISNTGLLDGPVFGRPVAMWLVPLVDDSGAENKLEVTPSVAPIDSNILNLINKLNPSHRYYPLLNLKEVERQQEASVFLEDSVGVREKIRDGRSGEKFELWGVPHAYIKQISRLCVAVGVVLIDECGNLLGIVEQDSGTGSYFLKPRPINHRSWDAVFSPNDGNNPTKLVVNFDYDVRVSDEDLSTVGVDIFDAVDPRFLQGMVDLMITATPTAAGAVTLNILTPFGHGNALIGYLGGNTSTIMLDNITTSTGITPTSVTHVGGGEYQVTFPPQTATNVLQAAVMNPSTGNYAVGFKALSNTWAEL
jgi:hypothetical protein